LGAFLQGIAHLLLPYRNIVLILPVLLILLYKVINVLLVLTGVLPNAYMKDVLPYRTGIIFPDSQGVQEKPGDQPMCAIMLSTISNHPLGLLGPGFKEVGDRFDAMVAELGADATRYGFLGASNWVNASQRTSGNELANIMYFENEEYMHAYAHGPMHTDTMGWWHETADRLKHVGIMHEVFACPRKGWEGVYLNYHPTGKSNLHCVMRNLKGLMMAQVLGRRRRRSRGRMGGRSGSVRLLRLRVNCCIQRVEWEERMELMSGRHTRRW
jgi:hypothetical protein